MKNMDIPQGIDKSEICESNIVIFDYFWDAYFNMKSQDKKKRLENSVFNEFCIRNGIYMFYYRLKREYDVPDIKFGCILN